MNGLGHNIYSSHPDLNFAAFANIVLPSATESHRINPIIATKYLIELAGFTAGWEFHPTPKYGVYSTTVIHNMSIN